MGVLDDLPIEVSQRRQGPLWKGPEEDGVTQSMLGKFLVDRERFRIHYVEGLQPRKKFNHRIEYGHMWHACEAGFAGKGSCNIQGFEYGGSTWDSMLDDYARHLLIKYPLQREEVAKWHHICYLQFPDYAAYWEEHPDIQNRTPLLQEQVFDVPYELPSGRTVRLRGKWDSVDLVESGVWLMENKTKGDIDRPQIERQLSFDLQTMMYLVALQHTMPGEINYDPKSLRGVRYNVVKRPLSGGKGNIKQKEPSKTSFGETREQYMERLAAYWREEPTEWFIRWNVRISPSDIKRFQVETLDPVLEQLCDWWEYLESQRTYDSGGPFGDFNRIHFRMPYGVYSPLLDGGETEHDVYLATGSESGLERVDKLFTELE